MNDDFINSSHTNSIRTESSYDHQVNDNKKLNKISSFRKIFNTRNNTIKKKFKKRSRKNSASISESSFNGSKKRIIKLTSIISYKYFLILLYYLCV